MRLIEGLAQHRDGSQRTMRLSRLAQDAAVAVVAGIHAEDEGPARNQVLGRCLEVMVDQRHLGRHAVAEPLCRTPGLGIRQVCLPRGSLGPVGLEGLVFSENSGMNSRR